MQRQLTVGREMESTCAYLNHRTNNGRHDRLAPPETNLYSHIYIHSIKRNNF